MDFRIGINLGDVLHKDDRIYGDGVNIAARIENLADPGGICISRGVYYQVEEKLDVGFAKLGPHSVKNINKAINIYKVLLDPKDAGKIVGVPTAKTLIRRWRVVAIMALAQRAIQMDPDDPLGYQALGNLYALSGQAERSIELRRKAAELAPNDLLAVAGLATRLKDFGGEQEAVELFEQAMRLSPKHSWWVPSAYGVTLHLVGRKEEAVASFKKAIALKPNNVHPHAFLAAVYADLGRIDEARLAADEIMRLNPKFTASRFMQSHTLHDPTRDARFKNLLLRAGLPDGDRECNVSQ